MRERSRIERPRKQNNSVTINYVKPSRMILYHMIPARWWILLRPTGRCPSDLWKRHWGASNSFFGCVGDDGSRERERERERESSSDSLPVLWFPRPGWCRTRLRPQSQQNQRLNQPHEWDRQKINERQQVESCDGAQSQRINGDCQLPTTILLSPTTS